MWHGERRVSSPAPKPAWRARIALPRDDSPFSILLNGAMDGIDALRSARPNIVEIYRAVMAFVEKAEEENAKPHPAPPHLDKSVQESILDDIDSFHDVPGTFGANRLHEYMFEILKTLVKKVLPFFDMANPGDAQVAAGDIVKSVRFQLESEFRSFVTMRERDNGIMNVGLYEAGNGPSAPSAA